MKIKRIRPSLNLLMSQSEPVYGTPIQYLNLDEPIGQDQVEYLEQLLSEV